MWPKASSILKTHKYQVLLHKIQSPWHTCTWDSCTSGVNCGTVTVWSLSSTIRARQSRSNVTSDRAPDDRTVWSICGRTHDGETRAHGKNLTLCHNKCHSDNVGIGTGWRDIKPVIQRLSHAPVYECKRSLAERLKSTISECLRKKYLIFRHLQNPCISSSTNPTSVTLNPILTRESLHRMDSQSQLQWIPFNSSWEIRVHAGAYLWTESLATSIHNATEWLVSTMT
jgi:hypothetical protein